MTRRVLLLLAAALLALCAGCWDYREINSTTFVAGAALDLDPLGGYILTVEIIDFAQSAEDNSPETVLLTTRGETIPEAANHIMRSAGKKLYWSHAAAFIVSRDLACRGISPLTDFLLHNVDTSLTASFLVSRLPTAHEILRLQTAGSGAVSYEIRSIMQNNAYFSQTIADFAYRSIQDFGQGGTCACLAMVSAFEQDGESYLDVSGCAVFDGVRMAAELDAWETTRLLALRGHPVGCSLSVTLPDGAPCSLQFLDSHADFSPQILPNGALRMDVLLNASVVVVSAETVGAAAEAGVYRALEDAAKEKLTQELTGLIRRAQQDMALDIFGFGVMFQQADPAAWRTLEADWHRRFAAMDIRVRADVRIEKSSAGPAILTPDG